MTLSPGSRLGPYEILSPLGAGGMGEVYRARDTRLGREVAIKVLPAALLHDADRLRRFEKEARSASALNHPNIVTVYEIGSSDSVSYIAMELVAGVTLRQVLSEGPLQLKKLLRIAAQVAEGLAKAHEAGIVHRDLKPENVMVTGEGLAKILDFGLAKLTRPEAQSGEGSQEPTVSRGTEPGIVVGTLYYMSPEQALGRPLDSRSDQFSLGSVLYEMATGKMAFARSSGPETMAAIIREEPAPVGALAPKTPAPLRWIIERCLGKEPHERYSSTQDLARDLATLPDHLAEATSSGELPSLALPTASARTGYVLAALGVLAIASASYWTGFKRAEKPPPSYQRLTFRRGTVFGARFAPDGQTVVYTAAWEGQTARIFATRAGSIESRSLQLPDARVLAVSSTGELAICIGRETAWESTGTLARVPLEGGAPRELVENASLADWSPDGRDLAIVHKVGGKDRLEFPIGKVLYETAEGIASVRVSPRGDRLAISQHPGTIVTVDLSGKATTLSKGWSDVGIVAWQPDAGEVWFSAVRGAEKNALYAVTPSGRERLVRREAGGLYLHDISRDGRVLLNDYFWHSSLVALPAGESSERDLSWMDQPYVEAISNDGRAVVFDELGEGGGDNGAIYLRATDGAAAIRLGEGNGLGLSPDARWVLSRRSYSSETFELLPTGPGQPRSLEHKGITSGRASFLPDGKRVVFFGLAGTGSRRLYVQNLDGGEPRTISPEGMPPGPLAISPDGRFVAAQGPDSNIAIYPVDGGAPRPLAGSEAGESPILWSADGGLLFVYRTSDTPARVFKVDVATGRRELWKTIAPADRSGLIDIGNIVMTPDTRSYAYSYDRILTNLEVVEGLR